MTNRPTPTDAARAYAELMAVGKPGGPGKSAPLWWGAIRPDEWPGFYLALMRNDRETLTTIEREMRARLRKAAVPLAM